MYIAARTTITAMHRFSALALTLALALPVFATQPNPSARQRELALKLIEVSDMLKAMASGSDMMLGQLEQQYMADAQAKGQDLAEAKELFEATRAAVQKIDFATPMKDAVVNIYAKYFTEAELQQLIAFYGSDAGRKYLGVANDLMRDSMNAATELLLPTIQETIAKVNAEHDKKRPWRRTMSDIQSVASALWAYSTDNDEYPSGDYASLKDALVPTYIAKLPENDIWGHAYAYVVSDDRKHFRLVSAGADSIFDWDSRRIAPVREGQAIRYRDRLEDDVIFADEDFIQLPVQAKPAENN